MANGMAGLYIGVTGLRSAQSALNTTAHNLANVNTVGYTRQQVSLTDTQYMAVGTNDATSTPNYGLGVAVSEIRRIRDQFIDAAYRAENGRLGFYSNQYKAVEEVEDLYGEMQGVTYQQSITNLYDAINELTKNPTSTVARSSLIQNATAFLDRSQAVYKGLKDYQTTLNTEVKNMVDRINELGNTIYELNKGIAKVEATGVEQANDLRDQRDNALDELSEYIDINYYEDKNGEVIVSAESTPFITRDHVIEMGTRMVSDTSLIIPTWPAFERDVYSQTATASNVTDTDKGALKGLLFSRGSVNVDYRDIPVMPESTDYDMDTPEGKAQYEADYEAYQQKQEYYNKYVEPSSILCAIAGIDKLVNAMVESINNVLCPEKQVVRTGAEGPYLDADGNEIQADSYIYEASTHDTLYDRFGTAVKGIDNGDGTYSYNSEEKLYVNADSTGDEAVTSYTYSVLDMDKTDYGMDEDKTVGEELFSRTNTERYVTTTDAAGNKVYIRNNLNETGHESLYALGNLEMNADVAQNVAKIPLSTITGGEDFAKANELLNLFDAKLISLNPEHYAKSDFNSFYNNYIGEFATMGNVLDHYVSNQQTMVTGYDDQRKQTEGVSSDEELEKMIKYQQSYNAASRYVNVVSQMLEHLVTSLGNA